MKKKLTFLLWLAIPLFCMAQPPLPIGYDYDAAGNRVRRKVIELPLPSFAPPAPQDSLQVDEGTSGQVTEELYFVEKIAQTEIKIYPNPTTEKITLEILGWQDLQTGVFTLFSLTGQLLQEQPVHSSATEVSLAGLKMPYSLRSERVNKEAEEQKSRRGIWLQRPVGGHVGRRCGRGGAVGFLPT